MSATATLIPLVWAEASHPNVNEAGQLALAAATATAEAATPENMVFNGLDKPRTLLVEMIGASDGFDAAGSWRVVVEARPRFGNKPWAASY